MLSPQRAVAASSGGAGEAYNFPQTRFVVVPAASPCFGSEESAARPCCRPSWLLGPGVRARRGPSAPEFGRGLPAGPSPPGLVAPEFRPAQPRLARAPLPAGTAGRPTRRLNGPGWSGRGAR
jgi:hypothetical protein